MVADQNEGQHLCGVTYSLHTLDVALKVNKLFAVVLIDNLFMAFCWRFGYCMLSVFYISHIWDIKHDDYDKPTHEEQLASRHSWPDTVSRNICNTAENSYCLFNGCGDGVFELAPEKCTIWYDDDDIWYVIILFPCHYLHCSENSVTYTVGHKKWCHFYFYDNFGKCGPIPIILSLLDS